MFIGLDRPSVSSGLTRGALLAFEKTKKRGARTDVSRQEFLHHHRKDDATAEKDPARFYPSRLQVSEHVEILLMLLCDTGLCFSGFSTVLLRNCYMPGICTNINSMKTDLCLTDYILSTTYLNRKEKCSKCLLSLTEINNIAQLV